MKNLTLGPNKGGHNPPLTSTKRPPPPQGSNGKIAIKLENWSVVTKDPYTPPELGLHLNGDLVDGKNITTSTIHEVNGNLITTRNSVYELGQPKPEYVEFCKRAGHHIPTLEEPIKLLKD